MVLDDLYLTNNIDDETINKFKQEAEIEVNALGVDDSFYFSTLVRIRIYTLLATIQIENEEAKKKYEIYSSSFNHYLKLAKGTPAVKVSGVKSVKIGRG